MPEAKIVPVLLDVRHYQRPLSSAKSYIDLWSLVEPFLSGLDPRTGPSVTVPLDGDGDVRVRFIDPAAVPLPVSGATRFAVKGILEPPKVRYRCDTCRSAGATTYGPFTCKGCGKDGEPGRVCDDHVAFLDGRLESFCRRHLPVCRCQSPAQAWCPGRTCNGQRAWCTAHLVPRPGDASIAYCAECFAAEFPRCEGASCDATGHVRCDQGAVGSQTRCGRRMCAAHAMRWQVFGSRSRGVTLCRDHHAGLKSAGPEALVELIVAVTAARADSRGGRQSLLPHLGIVRHIFINTTGRVFDMGALNELFTRLQQRIESGALQGKRAETALRLLKKDEQRRIIAVGAFVRDHEVGRAHFARLVDLLRQKGFADLAAAVRFSDFRPGSGILWVKVPPEMKGRFIGSKGAVINDLKQRLGIKIQLEKE